VGSCSFRRRVGADRDVDTDIAGIYPWDALSLRSFGLMRGGWHLCQTDPHTRKYPVFVKAAFVVQDWAKHIL